MEYIRSRSPLNNILVCREKHNNNRETRLWEKRVLPIIIIMLIIIALFIVACYNFSYHHTHTRLCILMNLKYKTEEEEVIRAVITMTIRERGLLTYFLLFAPWIAQWVPVFVCCWHLGANTHPLYMNEWGYHRHSSSSPPQLLLLWIDR